MNNTKPYKDFNEEKIKVPRFEEAAGFYATAKSSSTMKKIKSKNSKAEIILRKALWKAGYRYRLHVKGITGKPDVVFPKSRIVVFVDGDFWHGYEWEKKKAKLSSNRAYWIPKIERNMQRDKEVTKSLNENGWTVIRLWEHEVINDLDRCILTIAAAINDNPIRK